MALGRKTGGRRKGTPNRVDSARRQAFVATFETLAPELEGWIRSGATENPLKAAEILVRMAEYHVPKLAKSEIEASGPGGGPLVVELVTYGKDK